MSVPRLGVVLASLALANGCDSGEPAPPSGDVDVAGGQSGSGGTSVVPAGGRAGAGGLSGAAGAAGGADNPIACPEAAPRPQAQIIIAQQTTAGGAFASTSAFFPLVSVEVPGRTCVQRVEEACQVVVCTQPATVDVPCKDERATPVDAGAITVSGGVIDRMLAFSSGPEKGYPSGFDSPLFLGGETLTVTGAGATVPAFSAALKAGVVVSFPTLTKNMPIPRKAGLSFSWSGDAVAPVVARFSTYEHVDGAATAKLFGVTCTFAGSAPSAKIPPAAFADLPAGPISFDLLQADFTTVAAGKWDVAVGVFAQQIEYNAVLED